jgi:hypothetical protein
MTSETEKAKAWSKQRRTKAIDWFSEDVLAEAWLSGYFAKADFYIYEAIISGFEEQLKKESSQK